MRSESDLFPYQRRIVQHVMQHAGAMVWAGMGLGKTVATLTAIVELLNRFLTGPVLIVAPLRVIQSVWRQEAQQWAHTQHLRFSLIHGTPAQRITALQRRGVDVYLINYENLEWLKTELEHRYLKRGKYLPFNMVVFDEVTKVKNATANRSSAVQALLPYFSRRVGLTGEPAANGYKDLYGQYLAIDDGKRLGSTLTQYRERYLRPAGYNGYSWVATRSGQEEIHRKIADITIELSADDYLTLPPVVDNVVWVDLPPKARKTYDELESEFFAELDDGSELEVVSEASKLNKLIQIAGGAAYLEGGKEWREIHRAKLDALQDIVDEANGRPLLVGYGYRHEAERIAQRWPERPQSQTGATFLSSKLGEGAFADVLRRWEHDEIPMLCGHPASMGHGLSLQGSSANALAWVSLPWSLELYLQMNARLFGGHRRKGASVVHHILARDTVDEVVWAALQTKSTTQAALKLAVKRYRERRG